MKAIHPKRAWIARVKLGGEGGQTLVEYSLILLLVALVVIAPLTQIGGAITQLILNAANGF